MASNLIRVSFHVFNCNLVCCIHHIQRVSSMKPVVETGSLFDKSKDKKWISMMYWKCSEAAALWEGRYNRNQILSNGKIET